MNKEKQCTKGEECWYLHIITEKEFKDLSKGVVEMKDQFN